MTPVETIAALIGASAAFAVIVFQRGALRRARGEAEANRLAREIVDNAGEGIIVFDGKLQIVVWNALMEELTGLSRQNVIGTSGLEIYPQAGEQGESALLSRALKGETVLSPDTHYLVDSSGRQGWISSIYRPRLAPDGSIVGVVALVRDITERKTAEQQIEYQAYHDSLTGLANRRLFQEHLSLALALAQRRRTHVAVLFIDLDHFKVINDSLGHTAGDVMLRQVGKRLKAAVREGDTVARVGGDEFTIVLQEVSHREDAAAIAEKVLKTIDQPMKVNGQDLYMTTSIGITVFPEDGEDAETLLKNADAAMYIAKSAGRNTFQMASRELSESTRERMAIEHGLHGALSRGEMALVFQPQIEVESGEIVGVEALLRWNHPDRGLITPEHFIGAAEERGLILEIGGWVLREACAKVRRIHDAGLPHFRMAVNISARQFRDPNLLAVIQSALADAGVRPQTLELEITEGVAMENVDLTIRSLATLRRLGVMIAIDDFGTGHSSLSYLKRFEIDALKIDKSFVSDLPDKFEDAAIVSSVISLANGLGLRVVAEGVETEGQLEFLRENGCREVQGFYFSHPVQFEEIEGLLRRGGPFRAEVTSLSH